MVIEYIGNDFLTYLPCDTMTNKLFEQHTTLVHDNYANFLMKNELKQILGCIQCLSTAVSVLLQNDYLSK